jgi:CTP:phosphocholine cytidylyltransferase-like protein
VLSEITGYGRTTLHNAIKLLEGERWVQVVKIGSANAYIVNSRAFWQDNGLKKRHASFHAEIIASESEQVAGYVENWEGVELRQFPVINKNDREQITVHPNNDLPPPDQQELSL